MEQYRRAYSALLKLFPKSYRDRFGEGMEQTFTDLLMERSQSHGNLFGYVLWMSTDTFKAILKQHLTHMTTPNKRVIGILLTIIGILLVPLIGMQFSSGIDWSLSDFVIIGVILAVAGLLFEIVMRTAGKYRAALSLVIFFGVLWLWAELAVGVFTNWGS